MTHSPQRNEVEDRGADTYLSICFLYLPYCRGVGFQNGLHRRGFVVSIHPTAVVAAATRPVCGRE